MEFIFKDIPEGFFKAKLTRIKKENGAWGPYLRLIFTIIEEGELTDYRFSGLVKPTSLKQSKFYRWITNILGYPPDDTFCTRDLIGKECKVFLARQNDYYTIIDVYSISGQIETFGVD